MRTIDLNADLGEGAANDARLMPLISSCNIACGGHAGDAESMRRTLELAAANDVVAGAHPSYPDREGFGRRANFASGVELAASLRDQVAALQDAARRLGVTLEHMKPHGALYNDANCDGALASMLAGVASEQGFRLVGPPMGELRRAADEAGIAFIAEGFIDRAYVDSGELMPRSETGAVYDDIEQAVEQALSIVLHGQVTTGTRSALSLRVQTLCLHGDSPRALEFAEAVRHAFDANEIRVQAATDGDA